MSWYVVEKNEVGMLYKKLEKMIDTTLEDLREKSVEEILEETLEITRLQSITGGKYTIYYELCLAVGGPSLWVRTDGTIIVSWIPDLIRAKISDKKVIKKLNEIYDYLEEIHEE